MNSRSSVNRSKLVVFRNNLLHNLGLLSLDLLFDLLDLREVDGVLGVLLNEGDEAFQRAITFVVNELLGTGSLEFECREALDAEWSRRREVVLGCVKLGTKRMSIRNIVH